MESRARLTSKGQLTVPKSVRNVLCSFKGR